MSGPQSSHFKFKQFSLWHDKCGMKVSTDGVALGVWSMLYVDGEDEGDVLGLNRDAKPSCNSEKKVLDIGTGTGLLSLMLAQRYQSLNNQQQTHITALEIDPAAADQARFNIKQSPWPKAISVITSDVIDWSEAPENINNKYHHIICNPPYFTNALNSPDMARDQARHNDSLSFEMLVNVVKRHLSEDGHFELILPIEEAKRFDKAAAQVGLVKVAIASLQHSPDKAPNRLLVRYQQDHSVGSPIGFDKTPAKLIVRSRDGQFHPSFAAIAHEFYLKL